MWRCIRRVRKDDRCLIIYAKRGFHLSRLETRFRERRQEPIFISANRPRETDGGLDGAQKPRPREIVTYLVFHRERRTDLCRLFHFPPRPSCSCDRTPSAS